MTFICIHLSSIPKIVFLTEEDKTTYLKAKSIFLFTKTEVCNLLIPKLIWLYYTNKRYFSWNNIL